MKDITLHNMYGLNTVTNGLSSTFTNISLEPFNNQMLVKPKMTMNSKGNRLNIDFGTKANSWIYNESDVEIGISEDKKISYLSIEFKKKLDEVEMNDLKEALSNAEV